MRKVLITGGAGFIGSHTAELLLSRGFYVRVLDNLSSGHRHNLPDSHPQLEFVEGDITDPEMVKKVMNGVDLCLHLAAQVSVVASVESPSFSAQQNILGFVNVIEAARVEGVNKFVYASSAAVYGDALTLPLHEGLTTTQLSPYGLEKKVNESYAGLYHRLYNFSSTGMRYFNVFGPRQDPKSQYAGVISLFAERIRNKKQLTVYGDGKQTRDFIYVRDVAAANVAALCSAYHGVCNVSTGVSTSLLDLISAFSEITGNDADTHFVEPRTGDILHSLGDPGRFEAELGLKAKTSLKEGLSILLGES